MTLQKLEQLLLLLQKQNIKEFTGYGVTIEFHRQEYSSNEGILGSSAVRSPQSVREPVTSTPSEPEADTDASSAEIVLPQALRGLNPNYLRLTRVAKRPQ